MLLKCEFPVGEQHDFAAWRSLCGPEVIVIERNIADLTQKDFNLLFKQLEGAGIRKVIVYYSGHSENFDTSKFPTLTLKDSVLLYQDNIELVFSENRFSMAVMGYDSCNIKSVVKGSSRPIPEEKPKKVDTYPTQLWNFKGSLFFCSCSCDEESYGSLYSGGFFTQKFVQELRTCDGNWQNASKSLTGPFTDEILNSADFRSRNNSTNIAGVPKMTPLYDFTKFSTEVVD